MKDEQDALRYRLTYYQGDWADYVAAFVSMVALIAAWFVMTPFLTAFLFGRYAHNKLRGRPDSLDE